MRHQSALLQYNEARTVYLGNLARRENGVPPLRWNCPLTYAARRFSWDSTENRPADFCYSGTVTVSAVNRPEIAPGAVPVRLIVAAEIFPAYLPLVRR